MERTPSGIHRRTASNSYRVSIPSQSSSSHDAPRAKQAKASHFNKSVNKLYTPSLWHSLVAKRRLKQLLIPLAVISVYFMFGRNIALWKSEQVQERPDVPLVDRSVMQKLKKLEAYIGSTDESLQGDDLLEEEDPEEKAYLNFQEQDLRKAPPRVMDIPEPVKVPKVPTSNELVRDWPLEVPSELDYRICTANGPCKFLFPAWLGEQETKAQMHLYQLGLLATALNRTLVLPNVIRSRLGSCYANPFSYYYAANALTLHGIHSVSQADLIEWARVRNPAPTAQLVNMANPKSDYPQGAIEVDSTSDSTLLPSKPDRKFCLQPPRSWLNFSTFSPMAIFPPESWHKLDTTRFAFGEGVINTLSSDEVNLKSFRPPAGIKKPKKVDSPDILVINYELRYPILAVEVLEALSNDPLKYSSIQPFDHFPYANTWMKLAANLASSMQPFLAIHWRQETLPVENIMPCTLKLIAMLRDISDRYPELKKVYLATDYPIEDLEAGREGTVAHSGTFARLITEDHHRAMRVFLAAFKKGEVGSFQLTTYEREHIAGNVALPDDSQEGLHVNLGELDSGLLGIVDKEVAMAAQLFLTGEAGICGKESSFTRQIIAERDRKIGEQGQTSLSKGSVWDAVQRWSITEEDTMSLTSSIEEEDDI